MLQMQPNLERTAIEMTFVDFFTREQQFQAVFRLEEAEQIGHDLIIMVYEIKEDK